MIFKLCLNCGVTCWHNKCGLKDRAPRCTFCGHPVGHNNGTMQKDYAELVRNKQANKARLLEIKVWPIGILAR